MNPAKPQPTREDDNALLLQNELIDIVREEIGMNEEFATPIAGAIVRGLRKRVGGQRIYVPTAPKDESRDAAIFRRFNGTNGAELCREYEIGRSRLYQIIAKFRPSGQ